MKEIRGKGLQGFVFICLTGGCGVVPNHQGDKISKTLRMAEICVFNGTFPEEHFEVLPFRAGIGRPGSEAG